MMLISINDFDTEVQKRIKFFEKENACVLLLTEDQNTYFMNVYYLDGKTVENVTLCGVDENKAALMNAIRRYFKPNARF